MIPPPRPPTSQVEFGLVAAVVAAPERPAGAALKGAGRLLEMESQFSIKDKLSRQFVLTLGHRVSPTSASPPRLSREHHNI